VPGGGWSRPNGRGRWSRPAEGSRSGPGRGGRAVAVAGAPACGRRRPGGAGHGARRAAGWPAPEDPDSGEDAELGGRDTIADRLSGEVSWLRRCAGWLAHLGGDSYPPGVNLRPAADWPNRAVVAVDLAGGRSSTALPPMWTNSPGPGVRTTAAVLPDPRAERRRRLAEPDLEFRAFRTRRQLPASSTPQLERAWDAWQAERYQRGEISQRPAYTTTRSGHANDHTVPQQTLRQFRKLDALAVLTGPLLPAPPPPAHLRQAIVAPAAAERPAIAGYDRHVTPGQRGRLAAGRAPRPW
jgi:hypothetical protein